MEEYLFNHINLKADENYISNGEIVVNKKLLHRDCFKNFKNSEENILKDIPYEKGNEFDVSKVGTSAVLLPNERFGITYNKEFWFDYKLIKLFYKQFPWYFPYATVIEVPYLLNIENMPVLKFFGENDLFLGLILPVYLKGE